MRVQPDPSAEPAALEIQKYVDAIAREVVFTQLVGLMDLNDFEAPSFEHLPSPERATLPFLMGEPPFWVKESTTMGEMPNLLAKKGMTKLEA